MTPATREPRREPAMPGARGPSRATARRPPWRTRWRDDFALPLAVFALALAVRVVFLGRLATTPFWGMFGADAEEYWLWSAAIARGATGANPFFLGPLYPYVLAAFHLLHAGVTAVLVVQSVWGAIAAALVADTARRLTQRTWVGVFVGVVFAGYEMAVFLDGQVLMESLLLFLESLLLWLTVGWRGAPSIGRVAGVGALIGLVALGRPTALLLAVPLAAWAYRAATASGAPAWAGARRAAVVIVAAIATLLPATWHNYRASGELIPVTYSGGFNLFVGFNPEATGSYVVPTGTFNPGPDRAVRDGTAGDGRPYLASQTGRLPPPGESSAVWQERASRWIGEHPGEALRLAARKAVMMWNRREYFQLDNPIAVAQATGPIGWPMVGTFAFLGALGVAGLFFVRGATAVVLLGYVAAITLSGVLFFVTDRYRLHLMPALAVTAGVFVASVASVVGSRPVSVRRAVGRVMAGVAGIALVHLPAPGYDPVHQRWDALVTVGDAYLARADAASALRSYAPALELVESGRLRGAQTTTARLATAALYENAALAHMIDGDVDDAIRLLDRARALAPEAIGLALRLAEALAMADRCSELRVLAADDPARVLEHLFAEHAFWQRTRAAAADAIVQGMLCLDPRSIDGWALEITRVARTGAPTNTTLRTALAAGVPPERIALLLAYARALEGRPEEAEQALLAGEPAMSDPAVARLLRATYAALRREAPPSR